MASQYCDVLPGQVCWRSFDPALYLIFGVSGVQICLTKNRIQRVIPMPSRLWILEKRSLRHRLGDRARPGRSRVRPAPDMGNSTGHRPHFFGSPREARGCAPEGGRDPRDQSIVSPPTEPKVQKLSDFGITGPLPFDDTRRGRNADS